MRVYLGSDHAGFALKHTLLADVAAWGHEVVDVGASTLDPEDDYPPYCLEVGRRVVADPGSLGIVIGGSGNGEAIAANKVPGVRCALAFSDDTARLGREHNDANVLSLSGRMYPQSDAVGYAKVFLDTPFSEAPRHVRRIGELTEYERERDAGPAATGR